jgi:formylglycine-generating enzyme required for sulfatase activity/uncharacterized caspase-like protein
MARKIALLIGVGDYGAGFTSLRCPANGVQAMRSVLSCPSMGGFDEVVALINPDVGEMRSRICEVFAQLTKQDLVLFYFTGHGIKDMTGDFYLTTAQSELFKNGRPNAGTAVEADFLKREIAHSLAERKVIVLDCCFGAAFAKGFLAMNDSRIDIEAQLGGKGWCLLTASTSARYALEQEGEDLSVYTRYLVEGIKTGGAAPDGDCFISARHLHEYVTAQVKVAAPMMEPAMFNGQQGYDIVIAKAPVNPEQSHEQRYRKQVQTKVHNGCIRPAGRAVLTQWQQRLGLTAKQAQAIESEILQPYREQQQHLANYAEAIAAEKRISYPLSAATVRDLKDLQRLLGLRDEEVQSVEQQILGQPMPLSIAVKNQAPIKPFVSATRAIAPNLERICFKTVKVNGQGEIVETLLGESTTFVEDLGNGQTLEMVRIPGGTFWMGAAVGESGASENEFPQREVKIAEFWMGRCVVTKSQYQSLIQQPQNASTTNTSDIKSSNHPIESIFWTDAVAFCQQLSRRTGRAYRLPSAAEWEYACRAGTTTPFYFGKTLTPDLANYNGTYAYGTGPRGKYRQQTTAVGSFAPNLFGLYDMHGNVWEWCLDGWPNDNLDLAADGSAWRLSGQKKCLRGGSWSYLPTSCRSAYRLDYPFHNRIDDIGFRVVCQSPSVQWH